jgi:hypothetical protein
LCMIFHFIPATLSFPCSMHWVNLSINATMNREGLILSFSSKANIFFCICGSFSWILFTLLSLKFRPHRATRTPHRQHRTGVIHGTKLMPQHCKKGQKLYQMTKNLKGALHHLSARVYARNSIVQSVHMCTRRGCWAKNPRAC